MLGNGTRGGKVAALKRAADGLSLAGAPTFAMMALLTGMPGHHMADMPCPAMHGDPPLAGMAAMYVLMAIFHVSPWMKLVAAWRGKGRGLGLGRGNTEDDRHPSGR